MDIPRESEPQASQQTHGIGRRLTGMGSSAVGIWCGSYPSSAARGVHLTWNDIDFHERAVRIVATQDITGVLDRQPADLDAGTIPKPDETVRLLSVLRAKTGFWSKHAFISAYRVECTQQRQQAWT